MMTLPVRRIALLLGFCMPCVTMPLLGQRTPPAPPDARSMPTPAPRTQIYMTSSAAARRVLGVGLAQRGSMRDTAGLLITSITDGGAADRAGLVEGDRMVSIDGADLRVPADDAGSPDAVDARVSRLRRALNASQDSQPVRLELLSEGRRRTVSVILTRESGWSGFSISGTQLQDMASDIRASVSRNFALSDDDRREMERVRRDDRRGSGILRGRTDSATLTLDGLALASVDRDFAQMLGKGAERGALVVRTRDTWEPLRAGDVILSIEGRSVRDGNALDVTIDRSRDQRLEILRAGRQQTISIRAAR